MHALRFDAEVTTRVLTGVVGNVRAGGDVFEMIESLTRRGAAELHRFSRMTGGLVKALRACPQKMNEGIGCVCGGAVAILAMVSDLRVRTTETKIAFPFDKVGLAG